MTQITKDNGGRSAKDIIASIVEEMKLISNAGYICFTEQPLIMCDEMFKYFGKFPKPMYQPYGIGFKRDVLYRMGARNVIYGTPDEKDKIDPSLHWRFLVTDVDRYDYSWLREWRYPKGVLDFSNFRNEDIIVVAPSKEDEDVVFTPDYDVDFDYDSNTKTVIPHAYVSGASRAWRSINFDRVRKDKMNDYMVDASTFFEQRIGEDYEHWIGEE